MMNTFYLIFLISNFLICIRKGNEYICEASKKCHVNGNSSLVIVADNTVPELIVNCISSNGCKKNNPHKGLIVYSSANNTYINCFGEDSCEDTDLNFGIGLNGNVNGFNNTRNKVVVTCSGKQSCKSININNIGKLTDGLFIDTPDDIINGTLLNTGAFMNGIAKCGINSNCILQCGSNTDTCKDVKCYGNCVCQGNACPIKYNEALTFEPTSFHTPKPTTAAPVVLSVPTSKPTSAPIDARNTTSCDVNGCILEPASNFDVICGSQYVSCIIDCSTEGQCAESVKISANSNNVLIICSSISSCDSLEVYVDAASVITIQVTAEKAATNMIVSVTNKQTVVNIDVTGINGFEGSQLLCDGTCALNCIGEDGCKDVLYKCLATKDKCLLNCNKYNNECPIVNNLGDSFCATTPDNCTIVPDGDDRIVILNDINKVTILCNKFHQQCKGSPGLKIFSAAKVTTLECDVQDGCEDVNIKVGSLTGNNVPEGFNEYEFQGNYTRLFKANCNFNSACKSLQLYSEGKVSTILHGNGEDSLQDSISICNNCNSLSYSCREFNGCRNASILCTNSLVCSCVNEYIVNIGNETEDLRNTEAPRNSCPIIKNYGIRKQITSITNANYIINNNTHKTLHSIIPILVVLGVLFVFVGFIMINRRRHYNKIDGVTKKNDNFINKQNENLYAMYQVEMQ